MRFIALLIAVISGATPAFPQFKSYFDVSQLQVPGLAEPAWGRRVDEERLLYLCVEEKACPMPTGITIKGVIRSETLEEAFVSGELSPEKLSAQGKANAERMGSEFLVARPIDPAGISGVHMEAAANKIYFVTKFIGRGNKLLDIKVTSPDLELARKLSGQAAEALVKQVFE